MVQHAAAARHAGGRDDDRSAPRASLIAIDSSTRAGLDQLAGIEGIAVAAEAGTDLDAARRRARADRPRAPRAPSGCRRRPADSARGPRCTRRRRCSSITSVRSTANDGMTIVPPRAGRPHDRLLEALQRGDVLVLAIAVGRLDQDHVGGGRIGGRHQDRMLRASEVAAARARVRGRGPSIVSSDHRRAENVAGGQERRAHARRDLDRLDERHDAELLEHALGVGRRCRAAAPACASSSPCGWRSRRPPPGCARCRAARCRRAPACRRSRRSGRESRCARAPAGSPQ